MNNRTNAA